MKAPNVQQKTGSSQNNLIAHHTIPNKHNHNHNLIIIMSVCQLFTPDFGSSAFPMRSANSTAPCVPSRKRVRFSRQLTDEYEIANRKCRRGLSTSAEELHNRVQRLRHQLDLEYESIFNQDKLEDELIHRNDELFDRYTEIVVLLSAKKELEALKGKEQRLEDRIFNMRMETLRTKGLHEKLLKEISAQKRDSLRCAVSLAQSLWSSATSLQPIPLFTANKAA